jgi:Flp pilus assembly pilin Flp
MATAAEIGGSAGGGTRHMGESRAGSGQSIAEYALIVSLIVIVALVALTFFGTQINDVLSWISNTINGN